MIDAGGDLMRLVETERQLDRELAEARTLAGRLVSGAREQIEARAAGLDAEVRAAVERERLAVERDLETTLAAIAADADRAARAYDAATPGTVEHLARGVVARLLADGDEA